MLDSFHSAVIDVSDFEAGVDDYALLLGRRPFRIEDDRSGGWRSALFALASCCLEIRSAAAGGEEGKREGLAGIRLGLADSFGAWDDDALPERLVASGLPVSQHARREAEDIDGGSPRQWFAARMESDATRRLPVELVLDAPSSEASIAGARRAAASDPGPTIRALDHVVVLSSDVEATRDFYADVLGIRLALDRSFEKRGVRLLFFRLAGVTIEVGGRLGEPPSPERTDRFGGLAWQAPEIAALHARLRGEGFDVSELRDGHKPGTRVCTARDRVHRVPTLLIQPVG